MDVDKVHHIQKISQEVLSIEAPVGDEEDSTLSDFIPDEKSITPAQLATRALLRDLIRDIMIDLSERDLSGARLAGARLVGVNLEGANLEGADLEAAVAAAPCGPGRVRVHPRTLLAGAPLCELARSEPASHCMA